MGDLALFQTQVWPNGRAGNYGTAKFYLDESSGQGLGCSFKVNVWADGAAPQNVQVELISNINRRNYVKMYEPAENIGRADAFYMNYPMTYVSTVNGMHQFKLPSLVIRQCGVFRVTARFRVRTGTTWGHWIWHNDCQSGNMNQRDMCVVISPRKTLDVTVYECNPLNVEATDTSFAGRSTFEDFTDEHDADDFNPFNLDYVRTTLGFNTMWLMPVHPVGSKRWYPNDPYYPFDQQGYLGKNYTPGSPYATRNYWEINELLDDNWNWADAREEFLYMLNRAEEKGLNVFLDVAMNHAGWDAVLGQGAVDLGFCSSSEAGLLVRDSRPGWCTRGSRLFSSYVWLYRDPARNGSEASTWAPADQMHRHQWFDAGVDWYFGNYCTLGMGDPYYDGEGWFGDERDEFWTWTDPNVSSATKTSVQQVWDYMAYYFKYWLKKTGNRLDGIRADFAQGIPPQAWEYIINKTRQVKWDFIFLAEVLDEDPVRYRSNRHFDIITTKDHHLFRKTDLTMSDIKNSVQSEIDLYGYNACVMHNGTSHDEKVGIFPDAWNMLARYAVAGALYGAPMVWQAQPLQVPNKLAFDMWSNMKYYWETQNNATRNEMYSRINYARESEAALRSPYHYFLNLMSGAVDETVFAVARWNQPNYKVGNSIVLAFVNLRSSGTGVWRNYRIPTAIPLGSGKYQCYNLLADDPDRPLWDAPKTAYNLRTFGISVAFNYPNEAQYLQLWEVN